jgi:hypothetical protein
MRSPLQRLYQTKLQLLATLLVFAGFIMLVVGHWASRTTLGSWLQDLPVTEIGSTLFTSGLLTIALTYIDREDAEARATERLRTVLRDEAPAIRDAVYDGLAFHPDVLTDVAPEKLDQVIRNALAVRLGDEALAADVYADLHRQVVRAPERWRDARASVTLSPWSDGPTDGPDAMLVATVSWEYRTTPASAQRRFTCVSDRSEYRRLVDEGKESVWFFRPAAGIAAADKQAYELVQFTVDGAALPIRRSERAGRQAYSVELAPEHLGYEVKIAHTYRVLVRKHGHLLYLDVAKPTRGLHVEFDYAGSGIREVTALDFIASAQQPRTVRSPESVPGRNVTISFDGWVFPKSGVVFVWVLEDGAPRNTKPRSAQSTSSRAGR